MIEVDAQPWMRNGLCRAHDPDIFFEKETQAACNICRKCDVASNCLEYAMNDMTLQGVWGATSPSQRIRLHALRRSNARAN